MPKPTPEQKALQRDRASIRSQVRANRSPETMAAERKAVTGKLAMTVLKTTGFTATGTTPQMVANLTSELLANAGTVVLSGIDTAIQHAGRKLDLPAAEVAEIPASVKERLAKLVQ